MNCSTFHSHGIFSDLYGILRTKTISKYSTQLKTNNNLDNKGVWTYIVHLAHIFYWTNKI